jgi:ubiquitin-protein ligase
VASSPSDAAPQAAPYLRGGVRGRVHQGSVHLLSAHALVRCACQPLPSNMLEWHFCIEGPANSPYQGGFYHGIIRFPQVCVMCARHLVLAMQRNARVPVRAPRSSETDAPGRGWGAQEYPFKPPSIRMLTPSGRFEPNQRICLSMSDFHPETWNCMWSVSSILQVRVVPDRSAPASSSVR